MMTFAHDAVLTLYGASWCPHCKRVKRFLAAHRVPYHNVDIDAEPEAIERIKQLQGGGQIIPTVVYPDGTHEVNPSDEALAARLGLTLTAERSAYDLVIVGGGPAGLAAGIYAAREGIDAIILPAVSVTAVDPDGEDLVISLSAGQQLCSKAVIVATGAEFRRLGVPGEKDLTGAGVSFCATCDGPLYKGADEVIVIGGGDSALEEGLHLSEFAHRVRVLARSGLSAAPILQERVRSDPQFTVHTGMDVTELEGKEGQFTAVIARDRATGQTRRFPAAAVFVFIGLQPNTAFLSPAVQRDAGGFLITRPTMETSLPGVFAAGDARSGSTKQLGSAVGDGISALLATRRYLELHHHKAAALVDA